MTHALIFRRPVEADLDEVHRIHSDPRTNLHNPAGPDDEAGSRVRLAGWIEHWQRFGFGHELIETGDGDVLGVAGLRHQRWLDIPVLNLYYRLASAAWGRGVATAAGRRVLDTAARVAPQVPVLARTRPDNIASRRTATTIGLERRPALEVDDDSGPVVVFSSPWFAP